MSECEPYYTRVGTWRRGGEWNGNLSLHYEHRRFARSSVAVPIELTTAAGRVFKGALADLSIRGMYVALAEPLPVGTECDATIHAGDFVHVRLRIAVVGKESDGNRFEITGIERASFEVLRELTVRNAESPFECDTQIISNLENVPPFY